MAINLYIIRHGQSKMNEVHIMQGQKEFPLGTNGLTKKGMEEVEKTKLLLKNIKISKIFSSDLERCRETCNILNKDLKGKIIFCKELREQNCGDWEGKPSKETFTEEIKEKINKEIEVVPPKGESLKDIESRVINFINKILKEYDNESLLIVTHGALIQTMLGYFMNIPYNCRFRIKQKAGCLNHVLLNKDEPPQIIKIGCSN